MRTIHTASLAAAVVALRMHVEASRRRRLAFITVAALIVLGFTSAYAQTYTTSEFGGDGYVTGPASGSGQVYETTPNGDGSYQTAPVGSPPLVLRNGNQALSPRR